MENKIIKILAIETSCDETAAAIVEGQKFGNQIQTNILSNLVVSQIKLHQKYGGVYPEMASRAHTEKILPVIEQALTTLGTVPSLSDIDALAVTIGPGLIGSLLVGVYTAKTLSYIFQKPLIPINHLEGHIYANFVGEIRNSKSEIRNKFQISNSKLQTPEFPLVALTVAGGHTTLVLMRKHLDYQILGETLDDAAGEAFDKIARLLDLGYPGGPAIETEASKAVSRPGLRGLQDRVLNLKLPRPMIESDNLNFSFSGLKTAVLRLVRRSFSEGGEVNRQKYDKAAIAFEAQEAISDVLVVKTLKAAQKFKAKSVLLSGGVAANKLLRQKMKEQIQKYTDASIFIAPLSLCTDNAAMIGVAATYRFLLKKGVKNWYDVFANANARLG